MNDDNIIRPKIDLRQQPTIVCEECGEKLFKEGKEDEALKLLQEAKKFLLD